MFRLRTTALIAGSLLGIFVVHVTARGRSFPIEVTGTIKMFDRANHTFTFQSDKPARVLTIAVGRECQFFQNGAPAGEWILKKGARVKVSYFSTIFTGNIAVRIESNPVPEVKTGIIERIKSADRSFRITHQWRPLVGGWATNDRKEMSSKKRFQDRRYNFLQMFTDRMALQNRGDRNDSLFGDPPCFRFRSGRDQNPVVDIGIWIMGRAPV
jgi:hypothetical protein